MSPLERDAALSRLEASGLRGRGGSWFPAHVKWRAVLAEARTPVVVANGGEGEPGSVKDRFVMRTKPAAVIAGLDAAMRVLGADVGWIYLKASFGEERRRLQAAIDDRGLQARIRIHMGDDSYVGGEETAILESIEGRRAWPRQKPPRPASIGLFGKPTLVQNVDTLSRVQDALSGREQASSYVTIWGDVARPGVYAADASVSVRDLIEAGGSEAPLDKHALVFPDGAHGLPLEGAALDAKVSPGSLAAHETSLGLASFLVIRNPAHRLDVLRSIARFFERESCGQCPPCSLGANNLRSLIEGERPSTKRLTPQAAILETASFMSMHGYCGHSRAAAMAVSSLFSRFEGLVLERLRESPGGPGPLKRDPFAPESSERRALEAFIESV